MSSITDPRGAALTVFVGTYTEPGESRSEGIYVYRMDSATGELRLASEVAGVINPAFLALHPTERKLYAVNEVEAYDGQAGGGVSAFTLGHEPGQLSRLNERASNGAHPCHISLERTGRYALVANYTSGSIAMFPLHADGRLGAATDVIQHSGSSVHPERQTGPHAHFILPDPQNRFVIVTDLGLDRLFVYRMDLAQGKLHKHREISVQAGAGPRHLDFHPSGSFTYLLNELDFTIVAYRYDAQAGSFEELQIVPALPDDHHGDNLCADIHVTPDGSFVYASNRGHDSLVCYRIDQETGLLTFRGHTPAGGQVPRSFAIDPSGRFLLAANQRSNNLVTFRIDPASGKLIRTGHAVDVQMPVCVKISAAFPEWGE